MLAISATLTRDNWQMKTKVISKNYRSHLNDYCITKKTRESSLINFPLLLANNFTIESSSAEHCDDGVELVLVLKIYFYCKHGLADFYAIC